ncbi:MAG TPA: carbohydrate ABC transporter permease [Streptosporangiaceae bacterium]|nr:carbohydrate ABC transporter permease [Streptosporangiaceae bacterium]
MVTVTGRGASPPRAGVALVRRTRSARAARSTGYWLISAALVVIFLAPFLWILASSFKSQAHIFADVSPLSVKTFIPTEPTMSNYSAAFTNEHVGRALINSLIVSVLQVALTVLLAVPAAYALTRLKFRLQGLMFGIILVTFMIPAEAVVIPLFQIVSDLHLSNTLYGVFMPFIASPFALFLLRQAFRDIPLDLDEAALIDGASHWKIMTRVIVPNVRPALATAALMTFLFSWNAFLWPLIVIQSQNNQLVQVAIAINTVPGELPNWGQVFSGAVIATLPVLILFIFLQRYFVRGIVASGIKG